MRKLLFQIISASFATAIVAVQWSSTLVLKILGTMGHWMLRLADPDRLALYDSISDQDGQPSELEVQNMELRLLASAVQVRDHAKESGDWTDRHTEALNAVGEALVVEVNWEEESVHQYLRSLVESIDGLEYWLED